MDPELIAGVNARTQAEIGDDDVRQVRLGERPGERTMRITSRPSSTGMSQFMMMTSGLTVRMASSADALVRL